LNAGRGIDGAPDFQRVTLFGEDVGRKRRVDVTRHVHAALAKADRPSSPRFALAGARSCGSFAPGRLN
jgi:hypothetical protein